MEEITMSPIEAIFWDYALVRIYGIVPQYQIGWYRVDFAVPDKKIAIEIDGYDYHSTKEQKTNDTRRQRELELMGWRVIRFTGSEVHNNTANCINQVNKLLEIWGEG